MGEYNKYQGLNIGSGITYVPTGRFPIVGGNVFESYNDLINYINSPTSTAIGGTILFVVSDEDSTKNGVYEIRFKNTNRDDSGKIPYFVNGESNLEAIKLSASNGESISYTAGDGISIKNNEIKVKIADDNSNVLHVNENGELFVSQQEIPESVEYTAGNSIEISESNEINVKVSTTEGNSLTIDENGLFVPQVEIPESIEYTAGEGINISENNEISVKLNDIVSESENNILTIDENGKLSVPQVEIPEQYNVISSDTEEDFVKVNVTKNDESKQFELKTSIKTVSIFELSENKDGLATARDVMEYVAYYVQKTLNERHPNAEVYYDDVNDTLATNKVDGTIGPDDIQAIEDYIDNSDMGKY